jgi:hypothetical protein
VLLEQRIAKEFLQVGSQTALAVIGERSELDIEDLGCFQEQIRRKLALIMLYKVEVARRNTEP